MDIHSVHECLQSAPSLKRCALDHDVLHRQEETLLALRSTAISLETRRRRREGGINGLRLLKSELVRNVRWVNLGVGQIMDF
ncbi:hypothetical protein Mp_2g05260 [Marchantia polymorpha subsp. ruderalis]|uniref:Uncharacterized protein n=1 Tax=Marchantia polymorpha TaxID=3197 RepID=A0A2R6X7Z4_MARPO|nr:hypothetical protein MARPO_0031s0180 [Marchantia polymorpha]BBN01167.1 hypothetical protein Mp_2g05260 [Marchantia polymorpha subsp. ruderalis]|eukprot:PTQ42218.1 hypothetical protein MARPO_0031s0180 [Marchantia polymorpha]